MKLSVYLNLVFFILASIGIESCLKQASSVSSNASIRSTGGSGGQTGNYESSFSESGVSGKYKVRVPSSYSSQNPAGLMIYLHGDTASDYNNDWLFTPVANYTNSLNIIAVSVHAPSPYASCAHPPCWWSGAKQNGDYLHALIENKLFKEYNIDKDRIYFTGTSGGSQFITGMFVPRYASDYGGGAIPVCGGANIYSDGQASGMPQNITDSFKNRFKLFYYTDTGDKLYPQVVNSERTYSNLGFEVGSKHPEGGWHCSKPVINGVKMGFAFFEGKASTSQDENVEEDSSTQSTNQNQNQNSTNQTNTQYNNNRYYRWGW